MLHNISSEMLKDKKKLNNHSHQYSSYSNTNSLLLAIYFCNKEKYLHILIVKTKLL